MAQLFSKIKKHLEANSKNWDSEKNNIVLQNDGDGDYIHTWNVSGLAKPTDTQLNAVEAEADKIERNLSVDQTRRNAYGNIGDQLDEIYHNIDAWKARIAQIKADNPKED
jgi:hypothetical protein|tara:strand:+ start:87 stop:416 length:330 start_codon:yes stop_codon:yes gene_type:complete